MEVVLAKSSGFCFGVKRAVDRVYEQLAENKKIYTYGPIVHNDDVVADLEEKGVKVLNTKEELTELTEGSVVIRAHGVPKEIYEIMEQKNIECIDATCPFVKRIHKIVEKESAEGRRIIVIGNAKHPEVEGIRGWCKTSATVIESREEALQFNGSKDDKYCVVSQTTFNYNKFQELVEIFSKKGYDILAVNTICNATSTRQTEAESLAKDSDAMIVIGGTHSSNSRKLYEICKNQCENTFFIQTAEDLPDIPVSSFASLGITAGASTPNTIIQEVLKACQKQVSQNY